MTTPKVKLQLVQFYFTFILVFQIINSISQKILFQIELILARINIKFLKINNIITTYILYACNHGYDLLSINDKYNINLN